MGGLAEGADQEAEAAVIVEVAAAAALGDEGAARAANP